MRGYDGNPVQTFARERRVELAYDEYPPMVVHAFISAEDKTFFSHGGIDYPGPDRRGVRLRPRAPTAAAAREGGSTITQQVAKYLLQDNDYSVGRKIREAILAFRLESTLSKQQILELYLNSIFLGRNAYGVQAASRAYFDKDVTELTLPEAAYLAVLPKAPSNYDPVRETQRALDRRNYVLREMDKNGYITEEQWRAAAATPLGTIRYGSNEKFRQQGGYFMEEVRRELIKPLWREGRGRAQQRLCRRPLGPLVDGPDDAGRRRRSPSRRPRQVRRRPRLARHRPRASTSTATGGAARPRAVGTGFPDWRKAVVLSKSGQRRRASASPTARPDALRVRRGDAEARRRRHAPSTTCSPGMIIIVKQIGRQQLCAALDPRDRRRLRRRGSRTPAASWRCRAASTSSARATTGRRRRCASRARPSSRSSM